MLVQEKSSRGKILDASNRLEPARICRQDREIGMCRVGKYRKRWVKSIPKPKTPATSTTCKQLKLQKLLLRRPQAGNSPVGRAPTANGLDVVVVLVGDFEFRLGRAC